MPTENIVSHLNINSLGNNCDECDALSFIIGVNIDT